MCSSSVCYTLFTNFGGFQWKCFYTQVLSWHFGLWYVVDKSYIIAYSWYIIVSQSQICSSLSFKQYRISQLTSHQPSRALADCFRLSWRHQNMWATLVTGATLHEVLSKFSSDLQIPASKPIGKLTIWIGLASWNWKIQEKLAHKFHVKLFLCFCRKSCPNLGRWLNANLNGQFVIAIWRFEMIVEDL